MPRTPRSELFDEDNIGVYHCVNPCVGRAFLCGVDRATGQTYDHRKDWVRERLAFLAGIFAVQASRSTDAGVAACACRKWLDAKPPIDTALKNRNTIHRPG